MVQRPLRCMAASGPFAHGGIASGPSRRKPILGSVATSRIHLGFARFSRTVNASRHDAYDLHVIISRAAQRRVAQVVAAAVGPRREEMADSDHRQLVRLCSDLSDFALRRPA